MEITNNKLKKTDNLRKYNDRFAMWLKQYAEESSTSYTIDKTTGELISSSVDPQSVLKRASRIYDCLKFWNWDKYSSAKVLDLKSVNRCKDSHFCPNCAKIEADKYISSVMPIFERLATQGYCFYLLTLTVPSIKPKSDNDLREAVDKLFQDFSKFKKLYCLDRNDKNAFHNRSVDFEGGIRSLEITHNSEAGFHPHIHCILVTKSKIDCSLLTPKYKGKYSHKRKEFLRKNELECEIAKIWTLIHYKNYRVSNFENYVYDPKSTHPTIKGERRNDIKNLEVNFCEISVNDIKKTLRYNLKINTITSYEVFKQIFISISGRHTREKFGCMHNKEKDSKIAICNFKEPLPPECVGEHDSLSIRKTSELYTTWKQFKKISRFKRAQSESSLEKD